MLKNSFKYLIIAIVNLIILTVFLAFWTDELELTFNDWVRPREFLKIIGFSILSLLGMRILVSYFGYRNITSTRLKIKIAALLTFLISSWLYIDYSSKLISNVIVNGQFRTQIADKIRPLNESANRTKAENLTIKEYQEITKMYGFPKLPAQASNITFMYEDDDFLPDYLFTLTYDLPEQINVDSINYQKGEFSKYQSFVIADKKKRITYIESYQ